MTRNNYADKEFGRVGAKFYSGTFYEEFLPELHGNRGVQVYQEMADNDDTVGAILFAIKMLIRQASWGVQPAGNTSVDKDAAEFVESCLHDMTLTWTDTISEILSFLIYGWSVHEIVYKRRMGRKKDPRLESKFNDGLIGWQKLPIRAQESLYEWEFDDNDNLSAFVQMPAPDYDIIKIPADKILLFRTESRKDNPEGRSILRNAYRCFDSETEILTRNGWVRGIDLQGDEELATLNPTTKVLEYEEPVEIHKYNHTGEMYCFTSKYLDICVTDNHRLWVKKDKAKDFCFVQAADANSSQSVMRYADWLGFDVERYRIKEHITRYALYGHEKQRVEHPAVEINMDDWVAFLALFLSEGSTYQKRTGQKVVAISQKENNAEPIRALLSRLPWHFYEHKGEHGMIGFEFSNAQLFDELVVFGKAKQKFIPQYVKSLCSRQLKIFLDWYVFGDGSVAGALSRGYDGTPLIWTVSKKMSDDLQEIALKAGYEAQIRVDTERKNSFGKNPLYCISLGKRQLHKLKNIFTKQYDGQVWCPTTRNGIVYVRRNGKPCWVGNCWFYKKRIQEIEGIGIERDLAGFPVLIAPPGVDIWNDAKLLEDCEGFVKNIRRNEMEGLPLPAGWELKLLSTGGARQFDTNAVIRRYDEGIARTVIADFIFLGSGNVGSWALSSDKTAMFALAIGSFLDTICEVFSRVAIPKLIDINAPHFGGITDYPTLEHGDIESANLTDLANYLKEMVGLGLITPDSLLEDWLREQGSLPPKVDDDDEPRKPRDDEEDDNET